MAENKLADLSMDFAVSILKVTDLRQIPQNTLIFSHFYDIII